MSNVQRLKSNVKLESKVQGPRSKVGKYLPRLLFVSVWLWTLGFGLWTCPAADRITASVVITNAPTTNGMTFVITTGTASTRTWTNAVQNASTQVLTNETGAGSATNLALQLAATPPAGAIALLTGASNITVYGSTGVPLTISGAGSYFSVTYATNSITNAWTLRFPVSVESQAQRTNAASAVVAWLNNTANTNEIEQVSKAALQLLGLTNTQTIAGIKYFTNSAGQWFGIVSNSPAISGVIVAVTNGIWWDGFLDSPTMTNGVFYGPQTFNDNADFQDQITFGGLASAITAQGAYFTFQPESGGPVYLGGYGIFNGADGGVVANAAHFTNEVYAGTLYPTNLIALGPSTFSKTNNFPAGSDIAFGRYAVTSLANGNNAAVPVGTNVFIEVSGPSSAFTINGINAAGAIRDGKILYVVNQTGFDMTIAHQSGTDPAAANRIINMTGADRTTTGNGTATLIYSGAASRWLLLSFDP